MTQYRWLAWVLFGLVLVFTGAAFSSLALPEAQRIPERPDLAEIVTMLVLVLSFTGVGALVAWRRPENPIGWLFCVVGLGLISGVAAGSYVQLSTFGGLELPAMEYVAWVNSWSFNLGIGVALTFVLLLFPTGRPPSRRWRPLGWAAVIVLGAATGASAFAPGAMAVYEPDLAIRNPLGLPEPFAPILEAVESLSVPAILLVGVLAAISLVVRFRGARGVERQQLKWFLYPTWLLIIGMAPAIAFQANVAIGWYVAALGLIGLPVAAGIAILRHRLYDIDLLINRTLVYGALSASLAALYVSLVIALQGVLSGFTGGDGLAVAASTLAVAAVFQPLRRRIQDAVDRRFYRSRYDSQRTLDAFSARLRDEVDLSRLTDELGRIVDDTLQPASVSVWLR